MPDRPWIMTQTWNDLLFAHWRVERARLRELVPRPLDLDLHHGEAWLGIVPFHMTNVAPRFVPPLPWLSAFPELNVRTYVTARGKPGVYFFSLDATNSLAVAGARRFFHLPYFAAEMSLESRDGWINYESRRVDSDATFLARYRPDGEVFQPYAGTLEHFLTERYCLHTIDASGRVCTVDIHHPPWPLQRAAAEITTNTMAASAGMTVGGEPLLHFAKRQDMVGWPVDCADV